MESLETAKAIASLPLTVLLVLVLVGGYVEWWVYGTIHRTQLKHLADQIDQERARADQWQDRFLELNEKADRTLSKTNEIGRVVNGTAEAAAQKLADLEAEIRRLHVLRNINS